MDASELYRLGSLRRGSLRQGSTRLRSGSLRQGSLRQGSLRRENSLWRSGEVFPNPKSARDEDDEEALVWASLERLPTQARIRRGILASADGGRQEVDVENLTLQEQRALLERLVREAEEDNERFLLKLRDRINLVGIDLPTVEVRFENLGVDAEIRVGSRGLPTLLNTTLNLLEALANKLHILPSRKRPLQILNDVSGIVKPRRMTLLLGPPGSGKTSLLLALAGKLDKELKVSGRVTYNGHEMNEFVPQRTAAYISQHDLHLGEMTVRETLTFSARCQGVGTRYEMLAELSRREKAANIKPDPDIDVFMKAAATGGHETSIVTEYILKILGLDICADTLVGNEMLRGISGGQRKRVTTGEMLVGPAQAFFMDEISTGLDSSTTFQIVSSIRQSIHILGNTAVISLLQPAPETYELFDDIILLSEGQIVYQGPLEHVLEFFESMGFKCPARKGIADFLQEVTSRKDQKQYWMHHDKRYRYVPVQEFTDAFNSCHVGRALKNELARPFDRRRSHPAALTTSKYGVSTMDLLKTNIDRELLLMKRHSFFYIFKATQITMLAFIAMTVFLRTNMHRDGVENGGIYMGALFLAVTVIMFNGLAEIGLTIANLPVFFKQRDLLFYPSWIYTLPGWILQIPLSFMDVAVWVFTTYYVIGYDPNVGRFFKQFLVLLGVNQTASALFRLVGGLGRTMVVANTFGSFVILIFMVLSGFIISRKDIKKWWIWGYWISPMMYAQNGISTNEFLGHSWNKVLIGNETLGRQVLQARGVFANSVWVWIALGALIGYTFLFNFLYAVVLAYLKPLGKSQPTISDEELKEKQINRTGEGLVALYGDDGNGIQNNKSRSRSTDANQNRKGMILPFTPLAITFDSIRYSVDMPQAMKDQGIEEDRLMLLKEVSGSFRPGVLTALMGVSGAGKTTLMDVLAGRKTGGYIEGDISISGYPKKQETFARVSGYCEQNDIHSPNVTVYESLVFSAWLRLPQEVDSKTREMFIQEVMDLVELTTLRNALVGLPGVNGLSTEQRKRLTIAVELVANPSIIFMDEPTSGLDARAAAIVMRTVRNTVDTGRTVVCTIHQPSIDIFEAFDELLLLKRGGQEIYVGPLGTNSCHLIEYFESIQGVPKIKDGYNPATWMLEVTTTLQEDLLGVDFTETYKNSNLYRRNKNLIRELSTPPPSSSDLYFPSQYAQPFYTQCMACLWKQQLSYWRNPQYNAIRFFFTLIIALMLGAIFWNLGKKRSNVQDLFNAMGSMYAAVLFLGVQNSSSVQPVVDVERTVFYREKAAGLYSALPYAFGQVLIELPYVLVQTLLYGCVVYAMIGFEWTAAKFLWYLFFTYFTLLYFTFYGMMAVGLTPNYHIASIVSSAFYAIWNLFSGFLIPRPKIPVWWRWYYWMCPVAWTLYGLVGSQFGDVHTLVYNTGKYPTPSVSQYVRNYYGFQHDFLGVVAVVVAAFAVFFAFLFGFSIKQFNFQKR